MFKSWDSKIPNMFVFSVSHILFGGKIVCTFIPIVYQGGIYLIDLPAYT